MVRLFIVSQFSFAWIRFMDFNHRFFSQRLPILFLVCALISIATSSRILFLAPFHAKSHWLFLQSFVRALLDRGHYVTCITSTPFDGPNKTRYTEVLIDPPLDMETLRKTHIFIAQSFINFHDKNNKMTIFFAGTQKDLFQTSLDSSIMKTWRIPSFGTHSTNYSLSSASVQKFIHQKDLHFDLVINEEFYHDAYLMFGFKFKAPLILIG